MGYFELAQAINTQNEHAGTPASSTLEISRTLLQRQADKFLSGFSGETTYAVKANPQPEIIEIFHQCGIKAFDVASLMEMELVKKSAPFANMHYHNPIRSRQEIATAFYEFHCTRFAVDHMGELEKLASILPVSKEIEIAVRFKRQQKSNSIHAFESKFGADQNEAIALLKHARDLGFTCGITFHPGSQTLSSNAYYEHCLMAAEISKLAGVQLGFLNVGGGFPAAYSGLEHDPLESFFEAIGNACRYGFGEQPPRLECEPGRALVAPAGKLVTTIKAVRADKGELFLNDGLYGGLMEVCQFPAMRPNYSHESDRGYTDPAEAEWTVFGPTCDPLDVLPFRLKLPNRIAEGDRIYFHGLGAYSNATATRFNGYGSVQIEII